MTCSASTAATTRWGYFALRADKALIRASWGKAVIAYRAVRGVSLAAGVSIGAEAAWPEAIAAWLVDCTAHGWTPPVLRCGRTGGTAYRRSGLDVTELGDEAVVDAATFTLQGRPMCGVRQAVNRVQRAGYTCTAVRQRDVAPGDLTAALHAADAFRDGTVERGFSITLSRLGDPRDSDCVLVLARVGDYRVPLRVDGIGGPVTGGRAPGPRSPSGARRFRPGRPAVVSGTAGKRLGRPVPLAGSASVTRYLSMALVAQLDVP